MEYAGVANLNQQKEKKNYLTEIKTSNWLEPFVLKHLKRLEQQLVFCAFNDGARKEDLEHKCVFWFWLVSF